MNSHLIKQLTNAVDEYLENPSSEGYDSLSIINIKVKFMLFEMEEVKMLREYGISTARAKSSPPGRKG